jgi:hypothetical protein
MEGIRFGTGLNSTVMLDYWKTETKAENLYDNWNSIESRADYFEMYLPVYSSNGWE